jgi:hypothetical protein
LSIRGGGVMANSDKVSKAKIIPPAAECLIENEK